MISDYKVFGYLLEHHDFRRLFNRELTLLKICGFKFEKIMRL